MFYQHVRLLNRLSKLGFKNILKRNYSEVHGNIVKLSEDMTIKEIKIPFEETSVIYYTEGEKVESLISKIKATNEKIQKIDFFQFNSNVKIEENENLSTLLCDPFEIKINNHHSIRFFPGLNNHLTSKIEGLKNCPPDTRNNFNMVLINILTTKRDINEVKSEIQNKIAELINIYQKYEEEQMKISNLINYRHDRTQKYLIRLSILYFILHLILFYFLIYQIYGWDDIEPITYIVNNIYWIIAIAFFIKYKRKLDVSYFISDSFSFRFFTKQFQKFSFNQGGYDYTRRHLGNLKEFSDIIRKI